MKITWRGFFKFVLLCLAITAFVYLMYILFPHIKAAAATISFMPIVIKSAVVTCAVAGTAAALFVFGAICVIVYGLMESPKVTNKQTDVNEQKVTLDDVILPDNIKQQLREICGLQSPDEIATDKELNIEQYTGHILYGPPGTGKTMIAKAVANEANLPFFSISGADIVSPLIGQGARNIHGFFQRARENSPCIVFIDEIDTIGQQRTSLRGASERSNTEILNQLLTEMDGFNSDKGVVVIAATNRMNILDPALTRNGRLSNHICIPLPDKNSRKKMLTRCMAGTAGVEDLDFEKLAGDTNDLSGANVCGLVESAKRCAKYRITQEKADVQKITMADFTEALEKLKSEFQENEKVNNTDGNTGMLEQLILNALPQSNSRLAGT